MRLFFIFLLSLFSKALYSQCSTDSLVDFTYSVVSAKCLVSKGKVSFLEVTGGIQPFTYNIDSSLFVATKEFDGIKSGPHILTVSDSRGCKLSKLMSLQNDSNMQCDAGEDQFTFSGGKVDLSGNAPAKADIRWSPSTGLSDSTALATTASPGSSQVYTLIATSDEGCICRSEVEITILADPILYSGFSPNGDGINDTWEIKDLDKFSDYSLDIYNRWGQRVFHMDEKKDYEDWDGRSGNIDLPDGSYYYMIRLKSGKIKNDKVLQGVVTILR